MVTASYDGTVRLLDLASLQVTVLAATEDGTAGTYEPPMITSADCKDGHSILFADSDGGVGRCDVRERPTLRTANAPGAGGSRRSSPAGAYHRLHDRKISCVDVHPLQSHLVATASVDRTVRLWDWRGRLTSPLAELEHGLAVNAAVFSPDSGTSLLTTSYDDHVRIFNVAALAAAAAPESVTALPACAVSVRHNNQTGRWVTGFRAQWAPWATGAGAAVVVGSMDRRLDVYAGTTGRSLVSLASHLLTTIPAVSVAHPTLPILAGGVASGRCYLFRA